MDVTATDVSRRTFVLTAAGTTTAAAASGAASAQESPEGTPGETAAGGRTHTVDMTDDLVYDPGEITIAPGDTVVWENVGSIGHTVTAYGEEIPQDSTYFASGDFDSEQAARDAYSAGDPEAGFIAGGESYQHTFQVAGDYQYFCIPHEAADMIGSVIVEEGGAPAPTPGAGAGQPQVPAFARDVAIALSAGTLAVLSMTYLFIKFGGDYEFQDEETG